MTDHVFNQASFIERVLRDHCFLRVLLVVGLGLDQTHCKQFRNVL